MSRYVQTIRPDFVAEISGIGTSRTEPIRTTGSARNGVRT